MARKVSEHPKVLTVLDRLNRAVDMQNLVNQGKSQKEIAYDFRLKKSTVSDILKLGQLPKKYKNLLLDDKMTEEAAIVFARISDGIQQEETVNLAFETRRIEDAKADIASSGGRGWLRGQGSKRGKVTANDAKSAARATGAMKYSKGGDQQRRTLDQFIGAMRGPQVKVDLIESVRFLTSHIEEWFLGKITDAQLRASFLKNCKGSKQ